MMITGDYHHTAIAVARDVGMVRPQGQVVVIDTIRPCTVDFEHQVLVRIDTIGFGHNTQTLGHHPQMLDLLTLGHHLQARVRAKMQVNCSGAQE